VFTTLFREAMPLIRYRTHDISRLIPGPCSCGTANLLKIDFVRKRLESIVNLEGGDPIYPALFDDALFELPEIVDYQIALTRPKGKERLEFRIGVFSQEPDILPKIHVKLLSVPVIARNVARGAILDPTVELVDYGDLRASGIGKKLIVVSGFLKNANHERLTTNH
jgi:phenylacetate-CoA ligase